APYSFIYPSHPPETALSSLSRPARSSLSAQKIAFTRSLLCHLIFSPATKLKRANSFKQLYYPILVS
ncbi:hypothetical protein, partial [Clostridium sp. ATCC 29733]|uniref:hypothetical protein n=1 Tax=Clostridium sp. (strain ATCC 29733 / VPI C48-50) TaxID=1507 RepID=UPI001A98A19F